MSDVGSTTRVKNRFFWSTHQIDASGPTPGVPSTVRGLYGSAFLQVPTNNFSGEKVRSSLQTLAPATIIYYKMRARDANCGGGSPTYRTWVVQGTPDTLASRYTGAYCGVSVNFADITVVDSWQA